MPPPSSSVHDVVVVGARAAGASTAMLLARQGHRVLVLDRSAHGSDTLSTLATMRVGVMLLERWGLLDRLVAAGTPPIHAVTFDYAGRDPVRVELADPLYAARRTVLDAILADAAAESGAQVRRGVHVTGLVRDDHGVVRGVRARHPDGRVVEHRARLVVGADGRNSRVARDVGAETTHHGTVAASSSYTFVEGLDTDGVEWLYGHGVTAGIIPTNDGQACVFAGATAERFARELRFDVEAGFERVLAEVSPDAARRVAAARRTAPVRGFPGQPGWLRRPHGPGWALVGDAGYFKDPATAHGIADALRDAELLARAADDGLTGRVPMAAAIAGYEAVRDDLSLPLFEVTEAIAASDWTLDELAALHLDLSAAMKREVVHLQAIHASDTASDAVAAPSAAA